MLEIEFNEWLRDFSAAFPETQRWLASTPDPKATLGYWRATLSDVDPSDAAEVTRQMARGDLEAPVGYQREQTPTIVRKFAKQLRFQRQARDEWRDNVDPFKSGRMPLGPLVKRAMDLGVALKEDRISREDHDAQLAEVLEASGKDPKAFEPRYSCPVCLDQGVVVVWHPNSVREVKETGRAPRRRLAATVACSCGRGVRYANPPQAKPGSRSVKPLPVYDEAFYCRVASGSPGPRDDADLVEWVVGSDDKNRIAAFDEWNAGG